jgi:uncharacterized Zn finger protein
MPRQKSQTETELFPITDSLLKKLAGKAAYERGVAYFNEGAVQEICIKGSRILAEVQGTDIYHVTLSHNQRELTGACDCPASDGVDFCKHCVAVALMRADQLIHENESQNQSVKKISEPEKRKAILREYFDAVDKQALIEQLIDMIETDKQLRKEWQLKVQKSRPISTSELRKLINASIPLNKHLYRSGEVSRYFESVDSVVDFLVEKLDPADKQTLPLVEYTLGRIMQALETVDDSGGYRMESQERLNDLLISALQKTEFTPEVLAQTIFDLWEKPYSDLLPAIPEDFSHLFNKPAKDRFLELVKIAWENSPAIKQDEWDFGGFNYQRTKFESVLLNEAYAKKDFDRILQIKTKYANTIQDYLNIVDICLDFNKTTIAREWLEKARATKNKPYFSPNAIVSAEVSILLQEKRPEDAIGILWGRYQKVPELGLLDYINQIAKTFKPVKNWNQDAIEFHRSQLGGQKHDYERLRHTNFLVSLLIDHKEYQEALSICQANPVDAELLLAVAENFKQHPDIAIPLVYRVINATLKKANLDNRDYRYVVELFHHIHRYTMAAKQPEMFNKLLAEIRTAYKVKRNLMAYLLEAFGS